MISVLFVCLGNICRSPMAEAIFRQLVEKAKLTQSITVDSAGTSDLHVGEPPHIGTQRCLEEAGIPHAYLTARQLVTTDRDRHAYIIGMDDQNMAAIQQLQPQPPTQVLRLTDLIPNTPYPEVPDPWYTGDFATTYQLLTAGCQQLLLRIQQELAS